MTRSLLLALLSMRHNARASESANIPWSESTLPFEGRHQHVGVASRTSVSAASHQPPGVTSAYRFRWYHSGFERHILSDLGQCGLGHFAPFDKRCERFQTVFDGQIPVDVVRMRRGL
jgi:hypothetical protein